MMIALIIDYFLIRVCFHKIYTTFSFLSNKSLKMNPFLFLIFLHLLSNHFFCLAGSTSKSLIKNKSKVFAEFCWLYSYGRGVGTVPSKCGPQHVRIGILCYPKCPNGMSRFGFDCHSNCPGDFRDDGLFCRLAEYGRGAGYLEIRRWAQ